MNTRIAAGFSAEADLASRLVSARLTSTPLTDFPGRIPDTLAEAYACQDAAIAQWPDRIQGWKVGRILEPWFSRFGEDRLVGPIFANDVQFAWPGVMSEFPVFDGGFAAVEAEFVVRLGTDALPSKTNWTPIEARDLVAEFHVGIETAGSPLATINDLGPAVVISDFGNNAGLIVGPEVTNWRDLMPNQLASETIVEEKRVGTGTAASIPGGPLAGLAFALNRCASRGFPLKAGQFVSTGATTGVHEIRSGQSARVVFAGVAELRCRAVAAEVARG
jgi:2-keto-4-pentenoate hydratase